jgi:hypothetical protein
MATGSSGIDGVARARPLRPHRQERRGERGTTIYISDPIEGTSYALNADRKTAVRIPRAPCPPVPAAPAGATVPPPTVRSSAGAAGRRRDVAAAEVGAILGATWRGDRRETRPRRHPQGGRRSRWRRCRVEVIARAATGVGGDAALHLPGLPTTPRGKGETKELGCARLRRRQAEGRQTTHTIPAGAIGNEKPIVVATERWFSPSSTSWSSRRRATRERARPSIGS